MHSRPVVATHLSASAFALGMSGFRSSSRGVSRANANVSQAVAPGRPYRIEVLALGLTSGHTWSYW